jgi:hypothetical protein
MNNGEYLCILLRSRSLWKVFGLIRIVAPLSARSCLIYPFFNFEASYAAANQLANSLVFAIGLRRNLRQDSEQDLPDWPLVVFGATSSGRIWETYVAYESSAPEALEMECVSPPYRGLDRFCRHYTDAFAYRKLRMS